MWIRIAATALVMSFYATGLFAAEVEVDSKMTQDRMETILREMGTDVSGGPGMLELTFAGVRIGCISDVGHDRMRLIAQVRGVSGLTPDQVANILEANFHTALDARYATSQGVLYSAYIHPLSPLSKSELQSAVRQVSRLAQSFGTTYSSGELVYNGGESL